MANIFANYLQVVTKDTLENQVSLGICMAQSASHCGIIGAYPKQSRFQLPLQLGAKCLVISQLTIGILGVLRRHRIPLATHPHAATGVNNTSSNNCKSNSGSSKVGRPELAQSNTHLRLTQDRRMQDTMKNLTFTAGFVRCAITRKACVNGVHRFGFSVHPSHLPMQSSVLGVEAGLERLKYTVAAAISAATTICQVALAICPSQRVETGRNP